ncbi:MAG: hypothetical protein KDD61_17730 [Bdellovibrionales bacterium]|nr:hypothetical protein [Bdellovibrionales bacterium]
MTQLVISEVLEKPPEQLFSLLTSEEGWANLAIGPGHIVNMRGLEESLNAGSEVKVVWSCQGIEHNASYRIRQWDPGSGFSFSQIRGVFKEWQQKITLYPDPKGTLLKVEVRYELPFRLIGLLMNDIWVRKKLNESLKMWMMQLKGGPVQSAHYEVMTP